ncbi:MULTISPECIES: OmpP1/FadL family transporter [Legionella]|uniref:Outer membrane protein n=1 Tax=Legionella maceachernii TaxID=466 RepID=A0A0W0W401_9GAMM|nr:outer membrane protein transport protein [Legionella maceachernii]KTD27184.1 outer membrane protein [Legionella maceachernii]SKA13401.1 long-chain fatty acid transport protein [Legionella maceachernii]SUP04770.1 long-chain fatty acid outer membrane transporter [Legionella maceachernii]
MEKIYLKIGISILSGLWLGGSWSAVDQLLNGYFFLNPAELSLIKKLQLLEGNVLITPKLEFRGITPIGQGRVISRVHDFIPYLLSGFRFNDKFVGGITITPSAYGHIEWPMNSIVREASTTTKLFYYRFGAQTSYQLSEKFAFGVGVNLNYNKRGELDFIVPKNGNQINKMSGVNCTGDLGLYYQINSRNFLTAALYTGVNTYGHGTSSLGSTTVHNFYLNIIEAPVAFIGLQHWWSNKLLLEGKIYWSGWSIEKNINFKNKTTGSSISPANWSDTWSFQTNLRYEITDKLALLNSLIYETNPAPVSTNAIGYPLSGAGSLSMGLDVMLQKNFSSQFIYSYGEFLPHAKINSGGSKGEIPGQFQAAIVQFTYKA